eukprot:TRINITY_DN1422_c0_g1_i1.p1 TRINITY_DN1422_c0_g1~~TRINITY_DN1422_c0_g1_i1.p1  ORF type:complete len:168 (-),score=45.14 TRINITY_DN1422_c0_g1_i1:276-779(-)
MSAVIGSKNFAKSGARKLILNRKTGRVAISRGNLQICNKLVLKPTGSGTSEHIGGSDAGVTLPVAIDLVDGKFEVGRQDPADVIIPVPTVSSRHAMLEIKGDKVTVTDLNSTNGTWIDEKELTPNQAAELNLGSEVIFGDEYLAKFALASELESDAKETQSSEEAIA